MIHNFKLMLALVLLLASSLIHAAVSDETITRILDLSGLTEQVGQFPGLIKAGMEQARQQGANISDAQFSAMVSSVDRSILPSDTIESIKGSLRKSMTEAEASQLLSWYESDLGKEITRAEEKASSPEAYQQMMQGAQSLLADTERVNFAKRLDALVGATDMGLHLQEYSGIAVYSAVMAINQPGVPLNIEPFKAQMEAAGAQTRAAMEQMVIISYVYAYQGIEKDKLAKYEEFLNSPATTRFNKTVTNGISRGLEESVSRWAGELASVLQSSAGR